MTRKRKLLLNSISSLLYQVVAVACGFVVPRLILQAFGSDTNGMVNSIAQFLGVISFLELGVGAVVQSALYRPLAEGDGKQISCIMVSARKFFRKIAMILAFYVFLLMAVYPLIVKKEFGFAYTAALIAASSISFFAQYYFGIVNRLLLTADQCGYISYNTQTAALLLNTLSCVLLIYCGATIHIVKLTSSLIFLLQPLVLMIYVKRHYRIDWGVRYSKEPIAQKWNGVAQHVAAVVLGGTDYIVLTVLGSLTDVSIYAVYHLVVNGVKQLFLSVTNGIHALIGELWAKRERDNLRRVFGWTEWAIHTGATLIFGVTGILIVPFVQVYTAGISDADYTQPLFALLLTAANAGHCLRLPYNIMILAGGHYKQTQDNYIIAAALNIAISVITVTKFGLLGVAAGTLVAMLYQTIWMAEYTSKNLVCWPFRRFVKQFAVDCGTVMVMWLVTKPLSLASISYVAWIILAVEVSLISIVICVVFNAIFYKDKVFQLICAARDRLKRGKK